MSGAIYVNNGDVIKHTPTSAITAGDVVVQGDLIGVAVDDIAANKLGTLVTEGIFTLPKVTGQAFTVGQIVYWDDADDNVQNTADSGTNKQIGKVVEAAASADTTCRVKLTH